MDTPLRSVVKAAKKDDYVIAVGLFGSTARREKTARDVDICVFLKQGTYSKKDLSDYLLKYTSLDEKYDVHIFQLLPFYVQEEIIKDVVFMFIKDSNLLYDLLRFAHTEFEEYNPYYESYLEEIYNAT